MYNFPYWFVHGMSRYRQIEPGENISSNDKRTIENVPQVGDISIEQQIECPRCHDVMTLRSEFDSIGYLCGECDFSLDLSY